MAASYVEAIRARQPVGPYLLAGWSAGGVVAFEMARQLRSRGEAVALLALIDSQAPSAGVAPTLDDAELLANFYLDLRRTVRSDQPVSAADLAARLRSLRPHDRLGYLLEQAREHETLTGDADASQLRRLLKTFKAHHESLRHYGPQSFDGRALLFRAGREADGSGDRSFGWEGLARQVEVHFVDGDHYSILTGPRVRSLAERIERYIGRGQAEAM
jgi:thioesterase domain-containing protein